MDPVTWVSPPLAVRPHSLLSFLIGRVRFFKKASTPLPIQFALASFLAKKRLSFCTLTPCPPPFAWAGDSLLGHHIILVFSVLFVSRYLHLPSLWRYVRERIRTPSLVVLGSYEGRFVWALVFLPKRVGPGPPGYPALAWRTPRKSRWVSICLRPDFLAERARGIVAFDRAGFRSSKDGHWHQRVSSVSSLSILITPSCIFPLPVKFFHRDRVRRVL